MIGDKKRCRCERLRYKEHNEIVGGNLFVYVHTHDEFDDEENR